MSYVQNKQGGDASILQVKIGAVVERAFIASESGKLINRDKVENDLFERDYRRCLRGRGLEK